MKNTLITFCLLVAATLPAFAEDPKFPGLKSVMPPETYSRAGLENLTPDQRAALDAFLRDYVGGKQKEAAAVASAAAVDRAVKEHKVRAPELIESRIVGEFRGSGPRVRFRLENGQTWRPTDEDVVNHAPVNNPAVVIFKDFFGYKMFVEGAASLRVKRVE